MSPAGPSSPHASAPSSGLRLLGAVLAGGVGRRYGGPKEGVEVGGRSMLRRGVAVLRSAMDDVVVVSSRSVEGAGDVEVVPDRVEGKGPLGGLHAALLEARARGLDGVFLLACDLPLVDEALVRRVADGLDGAAASAPEGEADGSVEPLCAAWSLEVLPGVERRLRGDDLSLHGLFRAVDGRRLPRVVERGGVDPLLNVNTPADRKRAEEALGGRESP